MSERPYKFSESKVSTINTTRASLPTEGFSWREFSLTWTIPSSQLTLSIKFRRLGSFRLTVFSKGTTNASFSATVIP